MKILIAPDKFKGSLSSFEVCDAIAEGIRVFSTDIETILFPIADGGDGFASVMKYYHGTKTVECTAFDPLLRPITTNYQFDPSTLTAIIETAAASGLTLLKASEQNPLLTTTFGTGIMIRHAIEKGAKKIILGLGGTATNDAGIGILMALGFQFFDVNKNKLTPVGQHLSRINEIKQPAILPDIDFYLACDVANPLHGVNGAAYVYAPQKGANEDAVKELDSGLKHFSRMLKKLTGHNHELIEGTGAAGGIAAGLMGFFRVKIEKGTELIIEAGDLKNKLAITDLVITGEGKLDQQTREGKVAGTIASIANENNIPCIAICGVNELDAPTTKEMGFDAVYSIREVARNLEDSITNAAQHIINITAEIVKTHIK